MKRLLNHTIYVVFDFDKTITKYDTYIRFLMVALWSRPWRICYCLHLPGIVLLHFLGFLSNTELKQIFLKAISGGMERSAISCLVDHFIDMLFTSGLYADALKIIHKHRSEKHSLILASAGFDFYIEPIAKKLGFDTVICTKAEWNDDKLTGRTAGENCFGEAKCNAVFSYLSEKITPYHVIAYTDNYSDVPLLLLSDEPYLVNPTLLTRYKTASRHFPIVIWR
jgi:HAD superfamily hydrolase (TIGR01490 family)